MPSIQFDGETWWKLTGTAEREGTTVQKLITDMIANRRRVRTRAERERDAKHDAQWADIRTRIIHLRRQGMRVAAIAETAQCSTSYVSKVLCANGYRSRNRATNKYATSPAVAGETE